MRKNRKELIDAFGKCDDGFIDLPKKYSGTQISRLLIGEIMGCSYCFPHGIETSNAHYFKRQRNWKKYRKHQYKIVNI
jgi:hypothetical protein